MFASSESTVFSASTGDYLEREGIIANQARSIGCWEEENWKRWVNLIAVVEYGIDHLP
jgi:hypothetical protein